MTNQYLPTPGEHCKHQTTPRNGWCLQCVNNYLQSRVEPKAPLSQEAIGNLERLVAESEGVHDDHSQGYYAGAKKALEIAKGGSLDLGPFLGMEQELRECRRDLDLLNKAGARVREDSEGHRYVELPASKTY